MTQRSIRFLGHAALLATAAFAAPASGGFIFTFNGPDGLSAEAEFTLLDPTTLEIRLKNTSTGVPAGFDNSDQILTGLSWDFGDLGVNPGDITITGGSAVIGPTSNSVNFDTGAYGPGTDIGGEWGYGGGISGALPNAISGNQAGITPFGGANLDGPVELSGPQAGLISSAFSLPIGGLGAIMDELIATLTLSGAITEAELLADLTNNGTLVEFGSDAAFVPGIPAPGALAVFGLAAFGQRRRRSA